MKVAEALLDLRYLSQTHAIEYSIHSRIKQVSISFDTEHFAIERYPTSSKTTMPSWVSSRGTRFGASGSAGLWLPHIPSLLAECVLVPLADNDRPPSYQPTRRNQPWIDDGRLIPYPGPPKSDPTRTKEKP